MFNEIDVLWQEELSNEKFSKEYLSKKPVKIMGITKNWPAMSKWSEYFFTENYGKLVVPVREYGNNCYDYKKIYMELREYLDYLKLTNTTNRKLYLADWEISRQQSPLLQDFCTPGYFENDLFDDLPGSLKFGRTWIFIGHPHVATPLHQDTLATSAWLTMIQGSKKIRLISPDYADVINVKNSLFCQGNIEDLLSREVKIFEVAIKRGETLYVPARWFHEVINLDQNIMITKNFLDKWNFLHFTVQFEKKFSEPLLRITQAREKFIKDYLSGPHNIDEIQPYIPNELNELERLQLSND